VKILIVDDDSSYLEMLAMMVRGWRHAVTPAESGAAALDRAAETPFDLFLLDVFLQDMTAMELIPRLQSFQPNARIVTFTGHSSREIELELRQLGIAYYMAKPVMQTELKGLLDHMKGVPPALTASACLQSSPN
jgi:DNA-binding response OmpR family regulator